MKLLDLHAHNVFSIGTIDLDLRDRGLLLVTGWSNDDNNGNMAGKSSVANHCVSWGLYGRTIHGVKADAVINTSITNAKHCGVTLHFEGIDGKVYRIYRARKPNSLKLAVATTYEVGSGEEIWHDLSKRNEKDTQELINVLLGRDHKTFIQSDFFGQGREVSFLALTGSEQRAVIEEILPLTSLEQWHENATAEWRDAKEQVDKTRVDYKAQTERVHMAHDHYKGLSTQMDEWYADNLITLASARSRLNKIQLTSSGIVTELKALKLALPSEGTTQDALNANNVKIHTLKSQNNTHGYKIDQLTGDIDRRSSRPDVCMSCDQALPPERIKENGLELVADRAMRDSLVKQRAENDAKLYNLQADVGICNEALLLEARLAEKDREVIFIEKVRQLEAAVNPFSVPRQVASEQEAKENKVLDGLRLLLVMDGQRRDDYAFWKQAFGKDIKTMLFDQVCPFLEAKTNEYLADMNNGQIKVKFSTTRVMKSGDEKDQFCVTASSDTGSNIFELFSGAEKQLTSFAVGMALSDLAGMQTEGASSFMILDEPFLYQSPENCENLINFITSKLKNKSTILLISNEDNLSNLVSNRVHVVKNKGVTSIAG
jgi:DNA repair exonuclease SbcCD ATPase subunit